MDRIRKVLSPKSAAKEDDSSSDTEQQHKTNNKVCKTAALLYSGCHNWAVSCWRRLLILFITIFLRMRLHELKC